MNAIPLINNIPRPNINVGSIGSPAFNPVAAGAKLGGSIGGNVMRQNPASMPVNNEAQLRQEINTSLVALKKEAFSLETLIAQAVKTLTDINSRIEALEGKQGDYVKKSDVVDSITSGDMNPVTSNAVANSNAMPVNSVTSGNMHSVTSNAVAKALSYDSTQEVFIGYYDREPLYRKLVTVSGSSLPALGNTVVIDLPSEYSNRAVVNIRAIMVRDNFTWSIPSGKHFYVWLENRTKLYIEQSMTGYQTYYGALIWLDYVYLS